MDTIVRPPGSSDLTAAIGLVALGLARRITISPVHDARRLLEAAEDLAEEQDVRLELICDETGLSPDPVGIVVTRSVEGG